MQAFKELHCPVMTPDEPDSDRTQIQPPGARDPAPGFDKTQAYAPVPPTKVMTPVVDMGNGLPMGTRLAEFELTKLVGEGGFGVVYMAHDHSLQRRVALKEYMPSSLAQRSGESQVSVKSERYRETFDAGLKSFINEARLLASFDHPSLVKVYRFWEGNGTAYMAMPFLEGKTLRDILRSQPQAPDEAWLRSVLAPLTEALEVIHAEQCFHRDIAPDNVMQLPNGRWLLLDFGAARRVIGDMTQALTVILKPGYAPVEQYAEIPSMKQGPWTDVYALAAVVHCAITGRTPPPSVGRLLNDTYQPLVKVAAGRYSESFLAAIDRALVVRPETRTQTIGQLRQELDLDGVVSSVNTVMPVTQSAPSSAAATAPTMLISDMQATVLAPPPPSSNPRPAPVTPPAVSPQPAMPAATKTKSAPTALIGAGVVLLGALGFVGWKLTSGGGSAPPQASTGSAPAAPVVVANAPVSQPAPAPAVVVAPPVVAPQPPARFEPEREFARILQAQTAGFGVSATAQSEKLRISRQDQVRFKVTSDRDGYVHVVGLSADGSLALLVPNANSKSVKVRKGQTWSFPTSDGFFLTASEPVGAGQMMVIVSSQPRVFDALNPKAEGPVKVLASGDEATALMAKFKGTGSVLAGEAVCPAGSAPCLDEYGAAVMKFETQR
jgi:serine/threonine protein kinase